MHVHVHVHVQMATLKGGLHCELSHSTLIILLALCWQVDVPRAFPNWALLL